MRDSDRGCREGMGGDGVVQEAKGGGEAGILIVEGGDRKGCGLGCGERQRDALVFWRDVSGYSKECGSGKAKGRWRGWHLRLWSFVEAVGGVVYIRDIPILNAREGGAGERVCAEMCGGVAP